MSTEAMRLALEALELMYACYAHPEWISHKQQEEKILAQCVATTMTLRQTLAKQEHGEPVAWAEEIIDDFYALYNSEMIKENDSGDELIRLDAAVCAVEEAAQRHTTPQPKQEQGEPVQVDQATMELAESVGLIGPASRSDDLHAAIQRFHDLICANATIKATKMAADAISAATTPQPKQEQGKPWGACVSGPCICWGTA